MDVRMIRRRIITDSGCWEWNGAKTPNGYGNITVGSAVDGTRRVRKVHAVAYETWVGPVPSGLELDHLCRNPSCFNPEHLEPVTHRLNIKRAYPMGGTYKCGHTRIEGNIYLDRGKRRCLICEQERWRSKAARSRALRKSA